VESIPGDFRKEEEAKVGGFSENFLSVFLESSVKPCGSSFELSAAVATAEA